MTHSFRVVTALTVLGVMLVVYITVYQSVSHLAYTPLLRLWTHMRTEDFKRSSGDLRDKVRDREGRTCPNILKAMNHGTWRRANITETQKQELIAFYKKLSEENRVPPLNLQRSDSRCRHVVFPEPYDTWTATCDPDGTTPCCYDNVCVNKTSRDCSCMKCLDMRTLIFAEYATWRPTDKRCVLVVMTTEERCELLAGRTVLILGDSFMRRFYIGFLMAVRDDEDYGAFGAKVPPEVRRNCHGKNMFTQGICAGQIDYEVRLCDGRAKARYISFYHPSKGISPSQMIREVVSVLRQNKSLAVISFGSHYKLNSINTTNDSLLPLLRALSSARIPTSSRLLWMAMHARGKFKIPPIARKNKAKTLRYNAEIKDVLRPWGVPMFNAFNMTSHQVIGVDSSHYGLGVSRVKVSVFFNYLLELRKKDLW